MKKKSFSRVEKIDGDKSYIPDEQLVSFIQSWLHIHKKRDELVKEGKELSREEKKDLRNLDRMKVEILDNIVFPSLANLTYFFEAMSASDRASNAFGDELEELLDPRKAKHAAQLGDGMRFSSLQFRRNNLTRLIIASLDIPMKNFKGREMVDDFRIGLMYQLFNVIGDSMDRLLMHEYSHSQIWKSFWEDYRRMQGWLALLSRSVKESPEEFDRKIGFEPVWFSNKSPNGGWNF